MNVQWPAMNWPLRHRRHQPEWMDDPAVDPDELGRSLRFIRRANRWLGYTRATLRHLRRFSRTWEPGRRIDVLDVASGSADIPLAILRWARRRGFNLRIVALDLHPATVTEAARHTHQNLRVVRGDALRLPFPDASFDYAMTNMFLHHLDEQSAVRVLRELDRVSRRGVIVADLLRHRRAYVWIKVLTLAAGRMVRHDAAASVAAAFTRPQILALRDRAGLDYLSYHRHFAHRFVLAGHKRDFAR